MSLTPAEIETFSMALKDAFTREQLETLVLFASTYKVDRYVPPTATDLLPYALVVNGASRDGWERALLSKALQMNPQNTKLLAFEAQYRRTALPMPADPHDSPILRANRLFIDREHLRAKVRELNSGAASRVLVIKGERYSGKSHSRYFVSHLAENGGAFRCVVVDLVEDEINKPDELAYAIVTKMGGDVSQVPSQGVTTVARWGLFLASAIQNEVQRRGSHVWLVFDGLAKEGLSGDTLGVILNLAKRAEQEVQELRVVLLDLAGDTLPPEINDVVLRESIDAIDEAKCIAWLQAVAALRKMSPEASDLQIAVAKMLAALPPAGDKDRLRYLAREMWRIAGELKTPQPPAAGAGGGP